MLSYLSNKQQGPYSKLISCQGKNLEMIIAQPYKKIVQNLNHWVINFKWGLVFSSVPQRKLEENVSNLIV